MPNPGRDREIEQPRSAVDVGRPKILIASPADMGRVQRGDVDDRIDRSDCRPPIGDVQAAGGQADRRRSANIDTDHLVLPAETLGNRAADQPRCPGDDDAHAPSRPRLSATARPISKGHGPAIHVQYPSLQAPRHVTACKHPAALRHGWRANGLRSATSEFRLHRI